MLVLIETEIVLKWETHITSWDKKIQEKEDV